ncbi:MAG: general secretion pathway protein GspA [Gammaproteobacteria bacterium]|nr:MAG: general secretion pathway protein GspA [Gammaproteobacteria bacterium]
MYTSYFALSDLPFSIAPDPDYLFMSDRHREALSHLTYGLGTTGGFVLLTGEVGTGKTTISRRLMEQLPENTQTAFILNPTLSSQELLATICDQLKVRYRKTGATLKTLTDKIQEKLLKNHQANIDTLLIIDEAQHLQAEVLEQLRLLTNFETNTKKLLQVILIGQPELQQLLQRRDLRQLAQRITARYHLMPLNKHEVAQYIQHRLSVADCYRVIFDQRAVVMIHQLSQGIPRLINLLCDRSLWIAYGESKSIVDKKTVINASSEALGEEYQPTGFWHKTPIKIAAAVMVLATMLGLGVWYGQQQGQDLNPVLVVKQQQDFNKITTPKVATTAEQAAVTDPMYLVVENTTLKLALEKAKIAKINLIPKEKKALAMDEFQTQQPLILGYKSEEYRRQHNGNNIFAKRIKLKAVDGVSNDLLKTFQQAIDETPSESTENEQITINYNNIKPLSDMPVWLQKELPNLKFEMHMYASDGQGWVRVNGKDIYEGGKIAKNLSLEKILPQQVILNFQGEEFSMSALSSW